MMRWWKAPRALALQLTNAVNANGTTGITAATASTDITEIDQDVTFALEPRTWRV